MNTDLRPGKDHSQNDTKEFLTQSILYARSITSLPLLVRMGSGNDSIENLKVLHSEETKVDYIIKRNLRRESINGWLQIAKTHGVCTVELKGKMFT